MLELASIGEVRRVCRNKAGAILYAQGVATNVLNNCLLGPLAYQLVASRWMAPPFTAVGRVVMVLGILAGHAVGYYAAHRWMHTKRMYWAHRFHHRFNTYVVPVTANAVSIAEYSIAYMAPFIAGSMLVSAAVSDQHAAACPPPPRSHSQAGPGAQPTPAALLCSWQMPHSLTRDLAGVATTATTRPLLPFHRRGHHLVQ